jgi:hypothetical protein
MEIKVQFENIRQCIIDHIKIAKTEIKIAVAWFTNKEIFEAVLYKAGKIPISIVVINDDINNRIDGLNFQKYIDFGGSFYFAHQQNPMHNKFCIIDNETLITGSYNYTYLAESINDENVLIFKGCSDIIEKYSTEFNRIISSLQKVQSIDEYLRLYPFQKASYHYKNYGIRDINAYVNGIPKWEQYKAHSIYRKLELSFSNVSEYAFEINDVVYKQWREDYYIDKIRVIEKEMVLCFRTIVDDSFWIYGPKALQAWALKQKNRKTILLKTFKISHIRIDGVEILNSTEVEEILWFTRTGKIDKSESHGYQLNEKNRLVKQNGEPLPIKKFKLFNKQSVLTCEIHFNIENFPLEIFDLIEGIGCEQMENHWHCLDINPKLNREAL